MNTFQLDAIEIAKDAGFDCVAVDTHVELLVWARDRENGKWEIVHRPCHTMHELAEEMGF